MLTTFAYVALPPSEIDVRADTDSDYSSPLHRKKLLAALLAAQNERTYLLTAHQFMRVGGEWWTRKFATRVGRRASQLHREILGRPPTLARSTTDARNKTGCYPRGILEQAFNQVKAEILAEGGEPWLDDHRKEPYVVEDLDRYDPEPRAPKPEGRRRRDRSNFSISG